MNSTISKTKVRALGLCSGGLDSILSALVLRRQNVDVSWIAFETPFFGADNAMRAARATGIPLVVQNITPQYMEMLKNPRCGYGKCMNPCLDCHALMFRLAGDRMRSGGFDFLFSGEVLGQRPMSQTKPSLRYVAKNSGFDGLIVRPLSARKLAPTIPELDGRLKRELLLDISGRGRKIQIALAAQWGVSQYPAPAGGCLLTDRGFSRRLQDLLAHRDNPAESQLHLLKYGRHLRLPSGSKIVVGRTHADNQNIRHHHRADTDTLIEVQDLPGPLVLIPATADRDEILLAAALCAGYSKAARNRPVAVSLTSPGGAEGVRVLPVDPRDLKHLML